MRLLCITLLLFSCASKVKAPDPVPLEPSEALHEVRILYLDRARGVQDEFGFIESDHCDSLLFTSLVFIGGLSGEITAAREDGKWYRRPSKDCFVTGESASDISRDQIIGLLWYVYYFRRLDVAQALMEYMIKNDYIIGRGPLSRTLMTPSILGTLNDMIVAMGGDAYAVPSGYVWSDKARGFEAHLQVLHILLIGEIHGEIDTTMLERLEEHYERVPENALFSFAYHKYTDGDQSETVNALLIEVYFPRDRLPSSLDRCEEWLYQREPGADWEPCDEGRTHSGGELLFLTALLEDNQ